MYIRNPASSKPQEVSRPTVTASTPEAATPVSGGGNSSTNGGSVCTQRYNPVLKRFSGNEGWPQQAVILPSNEILFALETASDYVKDDKTNRFGFRCLVVGYESIGQRDHGLRNLEMELAYLGGLCSSSLMRRDLTLTLPGGEDKLDDWELVEETAADAYEMHSALLSKGFALEHPPTVHMALDGTVPFSPQSKERLFLRNFVHCVNGTSGGRLAKWLQPESYVDVDRCQVLFDQEEFLCNFPTIVTVVTKDQYQEIVHVPNMRVSELHQPSKIPTGIVKHTLLTNVYISCPKVEVKAVPVEEINHSSSSKMRKTLKIDSSTFGGHKPPNLEPKYEVTVKDKM
jgi:E3 ubiquitin-protein ligase MYCBP2